MFPPGLVAPVATAAHIHGPAPVTGSGGVLLNLSSLLVNGFGVSGAFSGFSSLSLNQRLALIDGETYINLHAPTFPAGEIRGQISR